VLLRLVTAEGTRARKNEHELTGGSSSARAALDALVRGRLLVAQEADGGAAYEVAHESLLQGWAMLRRWLIEDADLRMVRERVGHAAAEWRRLRRSRDALWNARLLADADRLDKSELLPDERAFLQASWRATGRARWIRRAIGAGVLAAIVGMYAVMTWRARARVDSQVAAHLTQARPLLAAAHEHAATAAELRRQAFAHFDAARRQDGEATWAQALLEQAEVERKYTRAARSLEAAMAQDSERDDVRDLLADTLFERALIARGPDQRDELLQRLAVYDRGGERMRRWNAPARLVVDGAPGIDVAVEGGASLGTTPVSTDLAAGSHVLVLSAPGRVQIRLPIFLRRDETLAVSPELPTRVPDGFVHVPPGRFQFGSAAEEDSRRGFFDTVPIHDMTTGAYLIARHEVTFGEWLTFLDSLSPEERERRRPRRRTSVTDTVELQFDQGGWRLVTEVGSARAGEPLRYPGRDRRTAADWRKLPVTGISAEDAEAYAAWLSSTGRVPGARLCSEAEWERAARGADGREYPHGRRLAPDDVNIDETYGKKPDAMGLDEVGSHPASRSPFGLDDMSGNAYEWTTSSFVAGDYVVRGGSYFHDQKTAQTVNRTVTVPTLRDATLGMRLCASLD
jgi:formylglycine-generating enzyme required for sulfatase activity